MSIQDLPSASGSRLTSTPSPPICIAPNTEAATLHTGHWDEHEDIDPSKTQTRHLRNSQPSMVFAPVWYLSSQNVLLECSSRLSPPCNSLNNGLKHCLSYEAFPEAVIISLSLLSTPRLFTILWPFCFVLKKIAKSLSSLSYCKFLETRTTFN